MLLKDVFFRRGIGFLEPKTIVLKGFENEDLGVNQETNFLNALNERMGYVFAHLDHQDP
jgi:RecQ-mediated genome instability protein 1